MALPVDVSDREAEVLAAVGAHLSNAQIAGRLHLSVRTVEGHVSSLLRKYGVADRRELAALVGPDAGPGPPQGGVAGLPVARTSFVGRGEEQAAILAALARERLVTLVGPGGVGKTRLAAVVAEAAVFPFGGAFVDLVPAREDTVAQAVAAALGVAEAAQQPLEAAIAGRLGRGRSLLVLDNCEHVVDAVAGFAERVLAACRTVTLLATSRERLAVPGERVVAVGPLPLGSDAERLFADRAVAPVEPGAVADLCSRLDGLPLAIELAAARSATLGGPGLLTGLGDYLRLLAGGRGRAVRHRSLRAVLGWSHDLLDDEERRLFRALAAFAGAFDLPAAASVACLELAVAADVLGRLVDKSLVVHERGRWRLLATVRAVAADKLAEAGETVQVRQRHRRWAVERAAVLAGPRAGDGWRDEVDAALDDLRDALAACPPGPDPDGHALARSLGRITHARGFLQEARHRYAQARGHAATPDEAARDLRSAADCAEVGHDSGGAFDLLVEAGRTAADGNAAAIALARAVELACRCPATFTVEVPHDRLRALQADAVAACDGRDPVAAARLAIAAAWNAGPRKLAPERVLAEEAVAAARRTGDPLVVSAALGALRGAAAGEGRLREAHRICAERRELLPEMDPADPQGAAEIEDVLAVACADAVAVGEPGTALDVAGRILDGDVHGDSPHLSLSTVLPALVLSGDLDRALRYAPAMWAGWERAGRPPAVWMPVAARFGALAAALRGDGEQAALWDARAREAGTANVFHAQHAPLAVFTQARAAVHAGRTTRVRPPEPAAGRYHAYAVAAHAELAVVAGWPDAPARLDAARREVGAHAWAGACLDRAAGRLHADETALAAAVAGFERIGAHLERAVTLLLLPARAGEGAAELALRGVPVPQPAPAS